MPKGSWFRHYSCKRFVVLISIYKIMLLFAFSEVQPYFLYGTSYDIMLVFFSTLIDFLIKLSETLSTFMYLLWSFCFEDDYVMQKLCLFMSLYWSLNYYAQDNLEKMFFPTNVPILVQETSDLIRSNKTRNLLLTRLYAMVCTLYLSALSKTSGFNILSSWYLALGNYWKGTNGFGIMLIDPQFIESKMACISR